MLLYWRVFCFKLVSLFCTMNSFITLSQQVQLSDYHSANLKNTIGYR